MSHKIPMPSRDELEALYLTTGTTISSLARHFNTSQPTVRKWLIDLNIERKTHKEASKQANNRGRMSPPTKEELALDYKYHSIDWIERKYAVGQETVYLWLEAYGIKTGERLILTSDGQRQLFDLIKEQDPLGEWCMNDRKIIFPQELDIVSHIRKVAIEYCGLYWHSELHKKDDYHVCKLNACEAKGYRLITVFESDSIEKVVRFVTQPAQKIAARTCQLVYDADVKQFEDAHHLMGSFPARASMALKFDGDIVATMTFSSSRYTKKAEWEMIRYTTSDVAVVGGAERLFKAFVTKYNPSSVVTYSDRRFSSGHVYKKLGFSFSHDTPPNYWYCKRGYNSLMSRQMFQKHKLKDVLDQFDPIQTERVNMLNNGYFRIYDCGSKVWTWTKK